MGRCNMTGNFARQVMFAAATAGLVFGIGSYADAATITFDTQPTAAISSFTEAGYTISSVPGDPGDIATIVNVGRPTKTSSSMAIRTMCMGPSW